MFRQWALSSGVAKAGATPPETILASALEGSPSTQNRAVGIRFGQLLWCLAALQGAMPQRAGQLRSWLEPKGGFQRPLCQER